MTRNGSIGDQQKAAWSYYGYPGLDNRPVGEVRYVEGWQSDQMTRLEWDVFIDGDDSWTVELPTAKEGDTPGTISTKRDDGEDDQTAGSMELLQLIDWDDTNITAVNTNLFVAGQGDYIKDKDRWRVVSVIETGRKETLEKASATVPILWPHPADPRKPDAPLFAVLPILDELDWLTRQGRTQSKQRVLTSGAWFISDGFQGPNGTDFWEQLNASMSARMSDTDDMTGLRFQGPHDLIKDGANYIKPDHDYDAVLDRRVSACIQRLAYGLPVPPEILLGMQAQSRATAFQVEENSYRAHIEPAALRVAQVAQDALTKILEGDKTVRVVPNPSRLLARKNSVEDVKWAKAEGLADDSYAREVLGIPEDAAPVDEADLDPAVKTALDMAVAAPSLAQVPGLPDLVAQIRSILDGTPYVPPAAPEGAPPIERDPANVAADPPVTAAATSKDLSTLLADIDAHLSSELAGVTVMATDRARQRLGAAARSVESVRNNGARDMTNSELATHLGHGGLQAAGVNVADTIAEPVDAAAKWWVRRIGEVWEQVSTLVPDWSGQGDWVTESVDLLATKLSIHITETLSEPLSPPLDAGLIRDVVDAAAGGNSRGVY